MTTPRTPTSKRGEEEEPPRREPPPLRRDIPSFNPDQPPYNPYAEDEEGFGLFNPTPRRNEDEPINVPTRPREGTGEAGPSRRTRPAPDRLDEDDDIPANLTAVEARRLLARINELEGDLRRQRAAPIQLPPIQPIYRQQQQQQQQPQGVRFPRPEPYKGERNGPAMTFLRQCELYFMANADAFPDGESRVRFALMFLQDKASSWSLPILDQHINGAANGPAVDWRAFQREFSNTFIDIDARAGAQRQLQRLKQTTSCSDYYAKFNELKNMAGYTEEGPLIALFNMGLKDHVKDTLALAPTVPTTLRELAHLCIQIDSRHFEREKEKRGNRQTQTQTRSTTTSTTTISGASTSRATATGKKKPLTQAQKDERRAKGLCLYCGKSGHFAQDCPEAKAKVKKEVAAVTTGTVEEVVDDREDFQADA